MRPVKVAIATALAADDAVSALVPAAQIYATERATLPTLPAVEVIAVSSERVDDGPLVRHALSVEVTVSHATEDGADALLDDAVRAVRQRIDAAERQASQRLRWRTAQAVCACLVGHAGPSARRLRRASIRGAAIAVTGLVEE